MLRGRACYVDDIARDGMVWVLTDPQGVNWQRWGQQFWPTVYLIDKRGRVRYRWEGELEYQHAGGEAKMGRLVEQLLAERG